MNPKTQRRKGAKTPRNLIDFFGVFAPLRLCVLLFFFCTKCFALDASQKPFVIVIPSYNNAQWYFYNLSSACAQNYDNFRIIYVDDASTDGTGDYVQKYIQENQLQQRVSLIKNQERCGALSNIYKAVWSCSPDEIIVTLDGDDWLAHTHVLEKLNAVYADREVWLTYGQFAWYPHGHLGFAREVPQEILRTNRIRDYDWVTTHLRTFYAGLFQKVKREDLLYNGEFFPMAWDLAFMWPMVEMAGVHTRFIPDVLYVYNFATPLNDSKVNADLQRTLTWILRLKERYQPLW